MKHSWKKLLSMTGGKSLVIRKVFIPEEDIEIEGSFELPPLAELSMEDQIFAAAFIKTHGSIKQMEKIFGISYPTVKNRLNSISGKLDFIKVDVDIKPALSGILDRIENGEISAAEALREIE